MFKKRNCWILIKEELLPLIVKTSFDLEEDIEFSCNSNIYFIILIKQLLVMMYMMKNFYQKFLLVLKQNEIKFNCLVFEPVYNENVTLDIFDHFTLYIHVNETLETITYENITWVLDENNDKIEFFLNLLLVLVIRLQKI